LDNSKIFKLGLIYQIKFPNGKSYIGRSTRSFYSLKTRYKREINGVRPVNKAIKSYGIKNVEFILLEEFKNIEDSFLNEREKYWIKFYKSVITKNGYNLTDGGRTPVHMYRLKSKPLSNKQKDFKNKHPRLGKKHSDETKKIISKKAKERFKKGNHPLKGKKHSNKTKQKIINTLKGKFKKENNPNWKGYPDKLRLEELIKKNKSILEIRECLNVTQLKLYESFKYFYNLNSFEEIKKSLGVKIYALTKNEILNLLGKGYSKRKITRDFKISNKTINKILNNEN
jgi:group I intron endonuclease